MMDGEVKWDALDAIIEYLEVTDIILFIDTLLIIKKFNNIK